MLLGWLFSSIFFKDFQEPSINNEMFVECLKSPFIISVLGKGFWDPQKRILGHFLKWWLLVGANQGSNQACYKQFQGSKEFQSFIQQFWDMSKSDQDSMVPGTDLGFVVFSFFPSVWVICL